MPDFISNIIWQSRTSISNDQPISLNHNHTLLYAKNIDEAIAIAKKREVFVSESIMVGSALDKKAVLIEVSPHHLDVYQVSNSNQLVCTNHFQSKKLKNKLYG